jgi:hypothetical protein
MYTHWNVDLYSQSFRKRINEIITWKLTGISRELGGTWSVQLCLSVIYQSWPPIHTHTHRARSPAQTDAQSLGKWRGNFKWFYTRSDEVTREHYIKNSDHLKLQIEAYTRACTVSITTPQKTTLQYTLILKMVTQMYVETLSQLRFRTWLNTETWRSTLEQIVRT